MSCELATSGAADADEDVTVNSFSMMRVSLYPILFNFFCNAIEIRKAGFVFAFLTIPSLLIDINESFCWIASRSIFGKMNTPGLVSLYKSYLAPVYLSSSFHTIHAYFSSEAKSTGNPADLYRILSKSIEPIDPVSAVLLSFIFVKQKKIDI